MDKISFVGYSLMIVTYIIVLVKTLNIIAGLIIGIATIIAVLVIFKRREKEDRRISPNPPAYKLGYALVELSRLAMTKSLPISNDSPQRVLYHASLVKISLICKDLGIEPLKDLSYDSHNDNEVFCYFTTLIEYLPQTSRHSFNVGKTAGNILLHIIPNYAAFTLQGEPRAGEFLDMAMESYKKLSDDWKYLFGISESKSLKILKVKIETLRSEMWSEQSLDSLIRECEQIEASISTEFEHLTKKSKD